jgi:hypothetical protein
MSPRRVGQTEVKMQTCLPLSHISGAGLVRSQSVVERRCLRDDDQIILIVRAVGAAVTKVATYQWVSCCPCINWDEASAH